MVSTSKNLQINLPELLSRPERARDKVFTAIMWGVYLYLWAPIVTLFAWLLGFEFGYEIMIRQGEAQNLSGILKDYVIVVLLIFSLVTLWSIGNLLRYGKLQRRHARNDVSSEQMAEFFDIDQETVERLRSTPSVSIEFDTEGRPRIDQYEAKELYLPS